MKLQLFTVFLLIGLTLGEEDNICSELRDVYTCQCSKSEYSDSEVDINCINVDQETLSKVFKFRINRLVIQDSRLNDIVEGTFTNCSIKELKFENVTIENFHLFSGLNGLEDTLNDFDMKSCNVKTWVFSSGEKFEKLSYFKIKGGRYSMNDLEIVTYLPSNINELKIVGIDLNSTSILPAASNFKSLNVLNLNGNRLNTVAGNIFQGQARHLDTYNLDGNPITSLPDDAFAGLPYITIITLDGTSLSTLRYEVFRRALVSRSRVIGMKLIVTISGLPLRCDCDATWLKENHPNLAIRGEVFCNAPIHLRGRSFHNVTLNELCPFSYTFTAN